MAGSVQNGQHETTRVLWQQESLNAHIRNPTWNTVNLFAIKSATLLGASASGTTPRQAT